MRNFSKDMRVGLAALGAIGLVSIAAACSSSTSPATVIYLGGVDAGSGEGGGTVAASGSAKIDMTSLDFGMSDCGGAAPGSKTITLSNTASTTLTWSAKIDDAEFSIAGATGGAIAPGGSAKISIDATAILSSAKAGSITTGTLAISTNDPNAPTLNVPLSITAQGATLQLTPAIADFGVVAEGATAAPIALTIQNIGNADATVALGSPGDADFTLSPASGTVSAGGILASAVANFTPSNTSVADTSAPITITGAVCGASPSSIELKGQGTSGQVAIGPTTLDFGDVNCGSTGTPLTFTVANLGNTALTWNTSLGLGTKSPYSISSQGGILLPNTQTTVTVSPARVPSVSATTADLYGDTVTVTTNVPGDTAHTVTLKETAYGAILNVSAQTIAIGKKIVGSAATTSSVTITNTGNADAIVSLSQSFGTTNNPFVFSPLPATPTTISAGGSPLTLSATFTPAASSFGTPENDSVYLPTTNNVPMCGAYTSTFPVTAVSGDTATYVTAGQSHTCAIGTQGIYCWGYNAYGEFGNGTTSGSQYTPTAGPSNAVLGSTPTSLATSYYSTCALLANGTVDCFGYGGYGQLGNGSYSTSIAPIAVSGLTTAIAVSGNSTDGSGYPDAYSCALLGSGAVSCWGYAEGGEFGNGGNYYETSIPVPTNFTSGVTQVSAGGEHVCALRNDNSVLCTGYNSYGELGTNNYSQPNPNTTAVVAVNGATGNLSAKAIATGQNHSCALLSNGTVACWGNNGNGQLGTGNNNQYPYPALVSGLSTATAIAAASNHTCAIKSDQTVVCWGNDNYSLNSTTPVAVSGVTGATQISVGYYDACAVVTGGSIYCWGSDSYGVLGNAAEMSGETAQEVSGF
jgi:alpha-tubulin suppressor-like RCC1 family protein